jgi:uncharacterized protein YdhG (YjbR/CyaY superfamily)
MRTKGIPPARTIDEYLAGVPVGQRAALERLRRTIRSVLPKAEECISYGLPAYRMDGKALVYFGAARHHCAFYPGAAVDELAADLAAYDTSKGTIRFQPDAPLPASLVRKLIKTRLERMARARR